MTQPAPTPTGGRASRSDRRRRERRVLFIGLAVSLVVHVIAVGVFGGWLQPDPAPPTTATTPRVYVPPSGMRVVEIAGAPEPEAAEQPEAPRRPDPSPELEPAREPVAVAPAPETPAPADDRTAADRLAPRVVDPRLYEPLVVLPWDPTFDDVEARVWAAIELMSDSMLAEADAAVRARDWTIEDPDGGKWGISPGKLHLGKITVPLPISFPVAPSAAEKNAMWYELDQQQERALILESFRERVKAIRERREREREEARADANGGSG